MRLAATFAALMGTGLAMGLLVPQTLVSPSPPPMSAACPPGVAALARLELLLGASRPEGGIVSDEDWSDFLAKEVTPRFPDGLTVLTGHGQWRAPPGRIVSEPMRLLLIWYTPVADTEARIEAIRSAYKQRLAQQSVMRVDGASCVRF